MREENAPELLKLVGAAPLLDEEEALVLGWVLEGEGETRELLVEVGRILEVPVTDAEAVPDTERDPLAVEEAEMEEPLLEVVVAAPIENEGDEAKTSLMLPMLTASKVYPSPTGTGGSVRVSWPAVGFTLLAMAKALLNAVLINSNENVSGSLGADVHLMVICPAEVGFSGTWRVRAETRGAAKASRLSLLNILRVVSRRSRKTVKRV